MLKKATALVVLTTFSPWAMGCAATQKTVQRPASEYVAQPPAPTETVRVRAVTTKDGERIDSSGDSLALLIGDEVVIFEKGARLVTADRTKAIISRGADTVSVRFEGQAYRRVLLVAETSESVTFVTLGDPPERRIPLDQIADLSVEEKGASQGEKIAVIALVGFGALILLGLLSFAIQGPP